MSHGLPGGRKVGMLLPIELVRTFDHWIIDSEQASRSTATAAALEVFLSEREIRPGSWSPRATPVSDDVRHVQATLPPTLVRRLDHWIVSEHRYLSRSEVVAGAIELFLEAQEGPRPVDD